MSLRLVVSVCLSPAPPSPYLSALVSSVLAYLLGGVFLRVDSRSSRVTLGLRNPNRMNFFYPVVNNKIPERESQRSALTPTLRGLGGRAVSPGPHSQPWSGGWADPTQTIWLRVGRVIPQRKTLDPALIREYMFRVNKTSRCWSPQGSRGLIF